MKIVGVIVLAAGVLCLAYGGFTYTKKTHDLELGPLSVEVQEKERVSLPVWLGVGLAVVGGALLLVPAKR